MKPHQARSIVEMNHPRAQNSRRLNSVLVDVLEKKHASVMAEYCEWRKDKMDSYRFIEDLTYREKLDRCRREIAAAMAPTTDVVSKMRLLDNWDETENAESKRAFETPHGSYRLWRNEVTSVWIVQTPDGELEGPFRDAQEAADWAAEDWDAFFCDENSDSD